MRKNVVTLFAIGITLFLASCQYGNMNDPLSESSPGVTDDTLVTQNADIKPSDTGETAARETPQAAPGAKAVEWLGISENGVDEYVFLENLDLELLTEIAAEFQALVEEEQQKEIEDPEFVLRGEWHHFITESDRYGKVTSMGDAAMKPLYWIIYKSDDQGLYEYICCMALEELSGYNFADEDGIGWATSKDFLDRFTKMVLYDNK